MSKICIALFFLIFLMSGCHTFSFPTSDSFSDISSSDDLPQSEAEPSEIHFFGTLASGNGDGAETENGSSTLSLKLHHMPIYNILIFRIKPNSLFALVYHVLIIMKTVPAIWNGAVVILI